MLHRNAFHLDNTEADRPEPGFRCVYAAMSLLRRTLEDPMWASSRCLNVAKPANATRSEQHHCICGEKLAVTWRVPGWWKRDTFPKFGCTRDGFRGCQLCASDKFGRNATHSSLHNRVRCYILSGNRISNLIAILLRSGHRCLSSPQRRCQCQAAA
jgi:hypothetical protein